MLLLEIQFQKYEGVDKGCINFSKTLTTGHPRLPVRYLLLAKPFICFIYCSSPGFAKIMPDYNLQDRLASTKCFFRNINIKL